MLDACIFVCGGCRDRGGENWSVLTTYVRTYAKGYTVEYSLKVQ